MTAGRSHSDRSFAGRAPLIRPGLRPTVGEAEGSEEAPAQALPQNDWTPPRGAPASLRIRRRRDCPFPQPLRTKLEAGARGRKHRVRVPASQSAGRRGPPGAALTMS